MIRPIFTGQSWAVSRSRRTIDDQSILDMLGLLEYAAQRDRRLEDAGMDFSDGPDDDPTELIFTYVLDALGLPAEGALEATLRTGQHPRFSRQRRFTREWFEERFYEGYLLDHDTTLPELLEEFKTEIASNLERHFT